MLTIAWDIDDVLNVLMRVWLEEWWKPRHSDSMLDYADIGTNPPHRLLGVPQSEYLASLDAFRLSGAYERMAPNQELLNWFRMHGTAFRHMALTAVPRKAAAVSAAWVMKHFGDWIRTFHFVPSPRAEDISTCYESSKGAYLKWLDRVDFFIDDHPAHVRGAADAGVTAFMVSRPWNGGGIDMAQILAALEQQRDKEEVEEK